MADAGGKTIHFPSLKTDVVADIQGDLATVTVTQTFVNPTATPLNAKYLFPFHKDAAVFAMTMEVGDEVVLVGSQGDETITVEEVAERLGTINYEIVSVIMARVPRSLPDRQVVKLRGDVSAPIP